jgi:uncharacterized protein with GYD domain
MAKYIMLLNWTDQGIKAIKNSGARFDAAKLLAKQCGCTIETIYMTMGQYDQVAIVDAPDDKSVATFVLKQSALGNTRHITMKAFAEAEYKAITAAV